MRVISGSMKGRLLSFPKDIRPTQNKIRKAVFDILAGTVKGSAVLELFAGSGAVGIEALSYGAKEVVFIDSSIRALKSIQRNLKRLGAGSSCRVYCKDYACAVDFFVKNGRFFDTIFLDPPYSAGLAKKSLLKLAGCDILKTSGLLIIEHHKKEELPDEQGSLIIYKQKKYGDTLLTLYRKAPEEAG